jgi:hypothetical protein
LQQIFYCDSIIGCRIQESDRFREKPDMLFGFCAFYSANAFQQSLNVIADSIQSGPQ